MATGITGILNHLSTAHPATTAQPMGPQTSGNPSQDNSASITANDFLTLLVTEMKNQDPTAQTDPNEYINQLVQVNSLQQLISINETLKAKPTAKPDIDLPISLAPDSKDATAASASSAKQGTGAAPGIPRHAEGNLSVPESHPAAYRLAQSLEHRPHK
jgi:flagellar basal-body rod modification protein FlgD